MSWDRQTVKDPETDRQTECPPPPNEWALRRTPGPRRRGHGGPAQGNREYVQGPHYKTDIVTQ